MASEGMVELNVGGITYATTLATLNKVPHSKLTQTINRLLSNDPNDKENLDAFFYHQDTNKFFVDRDGALFRFVIDYLRQPSSFRLPENFGERDRLSCEAKYYGLDALASSVLVKSPSSRNDSGIGTSSGKRPGYITVGYRGTFAFGRDGGVADVKFRKMFRILIAGKVPLCKEVA